MTPTALKMLVAGALCLYPLLIYFIAGVLTPVQLVVGLLALLAARIGIGAWIARRTRARDAAIAVSLLLAAVVVAAFVPRIDLKWLRLYPMLLDLVVFGLFFGSLFTSRPLIERFARAIRHDLPPAGIRYTRRVTQAWAGILLANALISFYTVFWTSFEVWSLYNGVIVYVLFAAVFGVEYLIRAQMRRRWAAVT
jgi:uncharacterized membrane protein